MAMPAAREPGPLVTRWRSRTVAKVGRCRGMPVVEDAVMRAGEHTPGRACGISSGGLSSAWVLITQWRKSPCINGLVSCSMK
jgi:hypothetical protein